MSGDYSADITAHEICREVWDSYWENIDNTNLFQSWEYGVAKSYAENWKPVRFLFKDAKDKPVALVLVLTKTLPLFGGFARINRGPVLLDDVDSTQRIQLVYAILSHLSVLRKRRKWWVIFAAPELMSSESSKDELASIGFQHRQYAPSWASLRLSLADDENKLLSRLNGKWRNLLRKAQRSQLLIEKRDATDSEIDKLICKYAELQKRNNFLGVTGKLVRSLANQKSRSWEFSVYAALVISSVTNKHEEVGTLVSIVHGSTATYFMGFTNEKGRSTNANYLMLWQAIQDAKKIGCKWYDLGGCNENTPEGIRHFKSGINAEPYKLIGEFRVFRLFLW